MARRRDILEVVFNGVTDQLDDSFTVLYDDDTTEELSLTYEDVLRYDPDRLEKTPAIFVDIDQSRPVRHNGVGNLPDYIERDDSGNVVYSEWTTFREQDIYITDRAEHRADEGEVFERLRRWIGRFDTGGDKYPRDLHSDIQDITVDSTVPADSTDLDDAVWGSQIQVFVEYAQAYIIESGTSETMDETVDTVENISQIDIDIDTDLDFDDSGGLTYTVK